MPYTTLGIGKITVNQIDLNPYEVYIYDKEDREWYKQVKYIWLDVKCYRKKTKQKKQQTNAGNRSKKYQKHAFALEYIFADPVLFEYI